MNWEIRRANRDDLADIFTVAGRVFAQPAPPELLKQRQARFEPERYLLVHDCGDSSLVGIAGSYTFDVTLPAGGPIPTQGVSRVVVSATHRRQGLLRTLMDQQLRGFAEEGLALSVLIASESSIYGRFGYGRASRIRRVRIDRRFAQFRADALDPGGVRFVDVEQVRALAPDIHRRWAEITPGAVWRNEPWWDQLLLDSEHRRPSGSTMLFHLVHPDGYAAYRWVPDSEKVIVEELFAVTDAAHAALWRVLLGVDLATEVTTHLCPLDDPLPHLLTDPRQVRTSAVEDGLWARILDVPAVLSARRYRAELDVVLEVADEFLGRGGRFRLRGGPDGAHCEPSAAAAQLNLDVATLSMLLFGSYRAPELARAGLLTAEPAVVTRCDLAFTADREAIHGSDF